MDGHPHVLSLRTVDADARVSCDVCRDKNLCANHLTGQANLFWSCKRGNCDYDVGVYCALRTPALKKSPEGYRHAHVLEAHTSGECSD